MDHTNVATSHSGRRPRRAALVAVAVATLAAGAMAPPASARPARPTRVRAAATTSARGVLRPGTLAYLRDDPRTVRSLVPARTFAPSTLRTSTVHSNFTVTYNGFPSDAKAAFQRAVDLWSLLVKSSQTIRIVANWTPLPTNQLGGAGPVDEVRDFPGAPLPHTWYPTPLANAITGQDLSPHSDIEADFTSAKDTWYFGTDGLTPPGDTDFESVVLHEIGHGLGLTDSTVVSGSSATDGFDGYPFPYDRLAVSPAGTPIPSISSPTALATALQSNGVRWGGNQGIVAAGGIKPYLYSPNPYEPGSSIAHLDEDQYPIGDPNSLMTPFLARGEAIHDPGDIVLGMMRDIGWTTTGPKGLAAAPSLSTAVGGNQQVVLAWKPAVDTGRQPITATRIYRYANGSSTATTTDIPWPATSTTISGLTNGTSYRFGVATVNASGASVRSALSDVIKPQSVAPFTRTDTFVKQQFADFLGRQPNAGELSYWLTAIQSAGLTPGDAINGIAHLGESSDPSGRMTRLYSAYFQRLPDLGGYNYWVGKLRHGTTLTKASDTFAASSEFKNAYGALSVNAFVTLVYQNVLHRAPDSTGLNHWVNKLNTHALSRGGVMLAFSESSENLRKMTFAVDSVLVHTAMLRKMPTTTEYQADITAFTGGETFAQRAAAVLVDATYTARF